MYIILVEDNLGILHIWRDESRTGPGVYKTISDAEEALKKWGLRKTFHNTKYNIYKINLIQEL